MTAFGWSYPAGAENDPNAPWNQGDAPRVACTQCDFESEECDGLVDGDPCPQVYTDEDGEEDTCRAVLRNIED